MTAKFLLATDPTQDNPTRLRWRVDRLDRLQELRELQPRWEALAARALEPNVFYEPWMLLPALEKLQPRLSFEVFAVYATVYGTEQLVGLMPFECRRPSWRTPYRSRTLLRYYYCGLCTPLLDRDLAEGAGRELLAALEARGGLYDFAMVASEGPVMAALQAALPEPPEVETISRALLRPQGSAEAYLADTFSARRRKEFRRLERRLGEHGEVSYDRLPAAAPSEAAITWVDEFLAVEASGWKGREASAFASLPAHSEFFRAICLQAHARGRLEMHALRLDGRPLALLCLFAAADGFVAFRTAYDERWARYSPGTLLCVHHSCEVHGRPEVKWVDSCADPNSSLDNRIWQQRLRLGRFRVGFAQSERLRRHFDRVKGLLGQGAPLLRWR